MLRFQWMGYHDPVLLITEPDGGSELMTKSFSRDMRPRYVFLFAIASTLWLAMCGRTPVSLAQAPIGLYVENFQLRDYRGKEHALDDFQDSPVVVIAFLGTECPLAKLYGPRLAQLARDYSSMGVALIGINANTHDANSEIAAYAQRHGVDFPLLKDLGNRVADALQAQRTPEVFVLDQQRVVRYWGRIDDQYGVGYAREEPTQHDLRDAIDQLLAKQPVSRPRTESVGCLIGRVKQPRAGSSVTYANQISRIFQRHCIECHRPGEIAPFSLTNYDEVVGWADTIAEVVREQRMPPWHANPAHGQFTNARLLSDQEKSLLYEWVDDGAPQGNPSDLPEPVEFVEGWRLSRPPEAVVAMRERPFVVPAEGTVEYQYFVVDPGFQEDKWIRGAEVIPGNRAVVHHAIVFFRAPEGVQQRGLGWLTAYVPGQSTFELPSHQARFIPAGSKLVFQMHYTPTGSPQEDVTRVGLLFANADEVEEELLTLVAINQQFEIPAFAEHFPIQASLDKFPKGAKLQAIAPHMHVRGKAFRVELVQEHDTSASRILLDVPRYDFNWQHAYALTEPLPLTDGLRLDCTAWYDNSERNLVNPDPSRTVRWGDQTWEEMMLAFLEVAVPVERDRSRATSEPPPLTVEQETEAQRIADDLIRRFDKDGDGVVRSDETPQAFAAFAFGRFDENGDKTITREEAYAAAVRSIRDKAKVGGL